MALAFPLSTADFFGGLTVQSVTWQLSDAMSMSQTGAGEVIISDNGPRLWRGTAYLAPDYHDNQSEVEAKLDLIRYAGRPFFVFNPVKRGPRYDPNGLILGAATPTIASLASNNRELTIQGLPTSYTLAAGDLIAFQYGTRYALHRLAVGGMSDASGVTSTLEVSSYIRPGAAVGAAVTLIDPFCKAIYVPGSFGFTNLMMGSTSYGSSQGFLTAGPSFQFIQTLGA